MEKIAICITTHNRKEVFEQTISAWDKYKPDNAQIFVVDDASLTPVKSDYRFDVNVGIARAKNKCLELAKDYDHIFLSDDDVRPKKEGWHLPYINSGMNHLCLTFEKNSKGIQRRKIITMQGQEGNIAYYSAPNGCMLYLRKICIDKAGGMRSEFGLWGFEHVEYSQRIYNLGLTPKPFMDIVDSIDYFDVLDWRNAVKSSLTGKQRFISGRKNLKIYEKYGGSAEFVEYR